MNGEFRSHRVEETFALGEKLGETLTGGEIILLKGNLGAGKTIFAKGLAHALGIAPEEVSSPTFTLVNLHNEGHLTLYHLDLYRLEEGLPAAAAVDLDDLLANENAVLVIEWAERLANYPLPRESVWHISIEGDGDAPRRITISSCV